MARKSEKWFRFLIYILPGVLFFSYYPLMHFGSSESMNFEISLPLIWLVVFDVLAFVMMVQRKVFWKGLKNKWLWLLLPVFLSLSVLWSLNALRGLLTVGVLWLIYLAGYGFWSLKDLFSGVKFKDKFWKVFFGSSLVICAWCFLQCILDLCGVARGYSLLCAGCTYEMFGFPHPNGLAIEPQFMGNLLLAPSIIAGYLTLKDKKYLWLFLIFAATLFLTFSRGAIYAFGVVMVIMTVWAIWQAVEKREVAKKLGWTWLMVILAFLFTLNVQGVMAAVSPTNDIYVTGVTKVVNQLSLGVIDIDGSGEENSEITEVDVVENPVENSSAFDGYVAESTDTRLRLSGAAVEVWGKDFGTVMFGVGLGGAGQALYVNGLSPAPKEIVQNQYASLLLESGLIGMLLLVLTLVLIVKAIWQSPLRMALICLIIAYGISLMFFSGLPNALHIYLLTAVIYAIGLRKKLVS